MSEVAKGTHPADQDKESATAVPTTTGSAGSPEVNLAPAMEEGRQALEIARAVIAEIASATGLRLIERSVPVNIAKGSQFSLGSDLSTEYLILREDDVVKTLD